MFQWFLGRQVLTVNRALVFQLVDAQSHKSKDLKNRLRRKLKGHFISIWERNHRVGELEISATAGRGVDKKRPKSHSFLLGSKKRLGSKRQAQRWRQQSAGCCRKWAVTLEKAWESWLSEQAHSGEVGNKTCPLGVRTQKKRRQASWDSKQLHWSQPKGVKLIL